MHLWDKYEIQSTSIIVIIKKKKKKNSPYHVEVQYQDPLVSQWPGGAMETLESMNNGLRPYN